MTDALEAHLRRQIEHSRQFFWHRLRWMAVREYLPQQTPFELVDVGAGAGLLGSFLMADRPEATYRFVEPIVSLREFLRETYGELADCGDCLDFDSARFVTLLDVLEHQEDDVGFMNRLVRKMAPGSVLLLTVPALQNLWSDWDVTLGHYRRYDKGSLLRCIDGLPISVLETSFLFPEMVPLGMLRSRRLNSVKGSDVRERAEFPEVPRFVNDVLYYLGTMSLALRRHWRTGTSLFLAGTVTS